MPKIVYATAACAALGLLFGAPALAGDYSNAFVSQQSPSGSALGNTLTIDQRAASNSEVRGIGAALLAMIPTDQQPLVATKIASNDPALIKQIGEGNNATLTLTGTGGTLQLYQSADPATSTWAAGLATGNNIARLTAVGSALGGVIQVGRLNDATLNLDNSIGLITQIGSSLTSTLNVGAGGSGTVTQIGNNSTAGTVDVVGGTNLTYTQIGNNLTQSSGVSVYSTSPAGVTITQSY